MRRIEIIVALCMAFTCGFALAGCSAQAPKAAGGETFSGSWTMVEASNAGEVMGSDDLVVLDASGKQVKLVLNDDGTAQFVVFGKTDDATWEASSDTEGVITVQKQAAVMTIVEDKLTMEQNGAALVFVKDEQQPESGDSGSAASGSAEASSGGEAKSAESASASAASSDQQSSASASAAASGSASAQSSNASSAGSAEAAASSASAPAASSASAPAASSASAPAASSASAPAA